MHPLSVHPLLGVVKVRVTPAEERGRREGERFCESKEKRERKRQTGNVSRCESEMSNRARRGSEGLICVVKTFPHIVSRAVRWKQESES